MTVKSSISLSDEQFAFAKAMVDAGQASSLSAVLQKGVELLRVREEDRQLERQALKEILQARAQSLTHRAVEFDSRLDAMLERKRKSLDVAS